ncbi:cyanophycin synthetase [Pontibacter ummariensis]|uniref:Cyanophycin synthetase n=1 Tax=Pontibacter ummariensis TaxID=1610492 RepID=A0A239FAW1_9BACT|nr:cyanophycin synthetase [Pontibacter ummariensis]PRY12334.1 cyanophycin synthetase [Pontibacter ummariensis]SNS54170.1 cyanophycin synthetase [Pontibacter ummariensis]
MNIIDLRVMRGPNYWSIKHPKIIVIKLEMGDLSQKLTHEVPHFLSRLKKMFPGMQSHRSAEGVEGGFFKTVEEGTTFGHVVQHVALELQTMAGMECGYGRCYPAHEEGQMIVVFSYQEERAGEHAAYAALRITKALRHGEKYRLQDDIKRLHDIREDQYFGPSTYSIISEAQSRGIPYIRLNGHSLIQLGYGVNQKRIQATMTCKTACFAVEIAGDKKATKDILADAGVPVPKGATVYSQEELKKANNWLGHPLVIKPLDGNHGKGATIGVGNLKEAQKAFVEARKYSQGVMVEQFIEGSDFRLLVINGKFVAAAKRTPAMVTGDGTSTIRQLIDKENKDPRRGIGHEKVLTQIKVDRHTRNILKTRNLTTKSVLPAGEVLYLKSTANISTGGTATDVTDLVDPYNVLMAERIAGLVGIDICGIDVMTTDIAIPLNETRGAVLEVNAAPGFRMHISPTYGLPRNVAEPVLDMLFPHGKPARIPIIAISGTNGKTTTTRLIAHIVKHKGYKVGYTTTDGIYIQDKLLEKGDTTGSYSTEFVLKDPTVNFAVLECARGGLLRSGLGFEQCDIGIVTNVSADHLGLRDIHTLEELAKVKAVIPKSVSKDGYAILNADDDLVYAMADELSCKVAFFSMDEENPRILKHIAKGGLAAVFENGYISIFKNSYKIRIDRVADVPITFGGKARFNIENTLAAVLAGYISHIEIQDIKTALRTFIPSPSKTPGRMNVFQFPQFEVLVDYAHNAGSLKAIGGFMSELEVTKKIGVVAGVGDRRQEDFYEIGKVSAGIFDEIIVRLDSDLRGKTAEEIVGPIMQGIKDTAPEKPVQLIPQEMRAIAYALEHAPQGAIVAIFTEDVQEAVKMVESFKVIQDRKVLVD